VRSCRAGKAGAASHPRSLWGLACQSVGVSLSLFGLSLLLVIDLDRPTAGGVTVSQQPMLDLREMIRDNPPARFNPPNAPASIPETG
jgi:hypothetical protein